ncbi:MAG: hypothetical protein FJZ16_05995 [Candidatus Omnitrophica bacterium]|nr:hypothetical protein [Candidatus Omnitrophota bacterium]
MTQNIWVIAEHREGLIKNSTLEVISKARTIADKLTKNVFKNFLNFSLNLNLIFLMSEKFDVIVISTGASGI